MPTPMAGEPMPFRNPAGHAGLRQNLTSLLHALTQFVASRLELVARESKAAVVHLFVLIGCLLVAALLALLGYLFLIVCLVIAIAHWMAISTAWTVLVAALLHFAGALLLAIVARGQVKRPMFRDTVAVLKEDSEWLKNLDQAKRR